MKTFSNQLHGPSSIVRVLAQCYFTAGVKVWKLAWWSTSPVFQHALIICYFVIGCASPIFQEHLSPLYANRQMFDCLRVLKLMATHQALRVFKESIICRCLHVRQTTDIQTRIKPYPQKVSKWLVWLKPCKVISGNFKSEPFFKVFFVCVVLPQQNFQWHLSRVEIWDRVFNHTWIHHLSLVVNIKEYPITLYRK